MKLRRTTDHELIHRLDKVCLPYDEAMKPATMDDSDWWIAEDEAGNPVAYAGLYTAVKGEGWLVRAGVLPQARGRGLQARMIHVRVARARKLGIPMLNTYTAGTNFHSARNLAATGFVPYKVDSGMIYWYRSLKDRQ